VSPNTWQKTLRALLIGGLHARSQSWLSYRHYCVEVGIGCLLFRCSSDLAFDCHPPAFTDLLSSFCWSLLGRVPAGSGGRRTSSIAHAFKPADENDTHNLFMLVVGNKVGLEKADVHQARDQHNVILWLRLMMNQAKFLECLPSVLSELCL
jgi:hypothetical protein